jgi:hypothetical protein
MSWLSLLFALASVSLAYFDEIRCALHVGWLLAWFIAAIVLTELTLLDSLHNQQLRKKVVFAVLLHLIPLLPLMAYWWWKSRWQKGSCESSR